MKGNGIGTSLLPGPEPRSDRTDFDSPRCVIVTSDDDYAADMVVARGLRADAVVRLDPGRLRPGTLISADARGQGDCLIGGRRVTASTSVWWRKPTHPRTLEGDAAWAADETTALLEGLLRSATSRWLNTPDAVDRARAKPLQLALADRVGLHVPDTVITTCAMDAAAFIAGGSTVVKATTQRYTSFAPVWRITPEDDLTGLDAAPCLLQREITPKIADWRVTLVADELFACRITGAQLDWRIGADKCHYSAEPLDADTQARLRAYRRQSGLGMIAVDLAEDADGVLWFLEANANPEYGFQEVATGAPISEAIRNWLMDGRT